MRTRIEIGSSGDIELKGEVSTPLTFSIADIRTPEKRNGSFSKTITIPGTKTNNKLLGNIFDINIDECLFNPKIKTPARLYINDVPQLSGFMQLLKIKKDDNYKIEYEVAIFGKNSNIFIELGNSLLTDLNYSELDHYYTRDEQAYSWTQDYNYGYVYPLIDYGFDTNLNSYDIEHLFPATYVRTYIDKIFANAGFRYQSTFFDSDLFKKLIIPNNSSSLILPPNEVLLRIFNAYEFTEHQYAGLSQAQQVVISNESNDPTNQYNTSTYTWTCGANGYYNIYGAVEYYLECEEDLPSLPFGTPINPIHTIIRFKKNPASPVPPVLGGNYGLMTFPYTATSGDYSSTGTIYSAVGNVFLYAGDEVIMEVASVPGGTAHTPLHNIRLTSVVFENDVVNSSLIADGYVDYKQAVPQKVKQKDLLLSLIKMFNLYIDVDRDDDRKLIIETRDDFYSSGTTLDWSDKLDVSKIVDYTPLGDLDFRKFNFTYKKDNDKYNKRYEEVYQNVYGNYIYDNGSEFLEKESKTEVIFSATPICDDISSDRVVPRLWDVSEDGTVKPKAFNIRLLYYGGLIPTNVNWLHTHRDGTSVSRSTYPFAGHVDSPTSPTLDLNFGVPYELYYNTTQYTNNNLFNRYHKKFIDEISDKDSKIVTAYFRINEADILNLDFRNQFYFENQLFRLNKIYDYNPIESEVTKCEFLKLKEATPFVTSSVSVTGGSAVTSGDVVVSPSWGFTDSVFRDNSQRVMGNYGSGNQMGAMPNNYLGNGSKNYIHDYTNNVTLLNSSGCTVFAGLQNVTLINTQDKVIDESDVVYINGNKIPNSTYKIWRANVTQTGVAASPTVSVFENTLDEDLIPSADGVGEYVLTSTGTIFTDKKTFIEVNNFSKNNGYFVVYRNTSTEIVLRSYTLAGVLADGKYEDTSITIIIFE